MNPYLIALSALGFFKDSVSSILKDKQVRIALFGLAAYFLIRKVINDNKAKQAATSEAGLLAVRLHNAFHPFVDLTLPFIGALPDGTNEDEVKKVAAIMKTKKNFTAVSNAYKALYDRVLSTDLESEGVYNTFFDLYGATETTTVGNTGNTATGFIKYGSKVKVKSNYRMRNMDFTVAKLGDQTEVFTVEEIRTNKTIAGVKGTWVLIVEDGFLFLYKNRYWVHIDGILKVS